MEGTGFFLRLFWVRLLAMGPRVWAGGLSVAMWFVLGGDVGVAGVSVGCYKNLRLLGGGSSCVCGERGMGELFVLGLGRLGV